MKVQVQKQVQGKERRQGRIRMREMARAEAVQGRAHEQVTIRTQAEVGEPVAV